MSEQFPTSGASRLATLVGALEEEIVLGWLQPRERLIEEDIAERFEAKRHVVREAIFELERMGLVERAPNKGAVVRMLDPADLEQIYEVRIALETLAAKLVPLPPSPEVLLNLRKIQADHQAAVEAQDPRAAFHANMAFHKMFFSACGNPHLVELIRQMAQKVHCARSVTATDQVYLIRACQEHWAITEAMENADRPQLVQLCHEHILPSRDVYLARLKLRKHARITTARDSSGDTGE